MPPTTNAEDADGICLRFPNSVVVEDLSEDEENVHASLSRSDKPAENLNASNTDEYF